MSASVAPAAYTLSRRGETLWVSGAVTLDTVRALAEEITTALADGVTALDLSEVSQADSSAISLLTLTLSVADRNHLAIDILGLSSAINSLMQLYEVQGFFSFKETSD